MKLLCLVKVNLKSCCVVPEELSAFAKKHKVSLLTHSDPQVPLCIQSIV